MTTLYGFELIDEQHIGELRTDARLFRHIQTGAELLSLSNDDDNKVFAITFRTPPDDSTGVAHILEHSVLCGSRKYPVKEPFVELLKGSLKTFLNAFTYPDKTCYPVASQNVQDFYNLIDVYLDAAFYPRLTPLVLQQEGWHLELESPHDPLSYKGVVFNEMKGAYSSPDSLLAEYSQQSLFPDNTYGLDSGGDPKEIPRLTFDRFKAFHEKYYHPSNARIYFYGNDDPERRLRVLNEYLKDFQRMENDSSIPLQRHFAHPKRLVRPFAAGGGTQGEEMNKPKGMVTVNWLMEETTNPELNLALQILEYILLGMPGSPLRKALIDSGLGEDLAGVGLEGELRQMYFSTGLKGIDVENADRIEALIMATLSRLATEGIDPQTIEAAVNTVEFRLRENNTGSYPRGLVLMLRALTTWLYDGNPLTLLSFEAPLEAIKARIANGENLFEGLIDRFFLNNTHRTTLVLKPDPELSRKEEAEERERLDRIRQSMSPDDLQSVIQNARELQRMQETPDPPEAVALIPTLTLNDLERHEKEIPKSIWEMDGAKILTHDIFTNGILYLDVGFNIRTLPQRLLPYLPLFGRAFIELGTEKEDFVSFTQRISRKTGGIRPEFFTSAVRDSEQSTAWMFLRGKSMLPQIGELIDIIYDMLFTVRLDNKERFHQMVLEEKARMERKLVPSGHQLVNLRLRAHFSEGEWAAEQMHGLSYLLSLRKLAGEVEKNWDGVLDTLEEIRRLLVNRRAMIFNVTSDHAGLGDFEPRLTGCLEALPSMPVAPADWVSDLPPRFEGLIIPTQVNYVGKGTKLNETDHRFDGSALVISRYLRNSWLWERIRVQGGAYGAFSFFDRFSRVFCFVSYRDPNLLKTLENFDGAADFLRNLTLSQEELTKAIIGTIGDIDRYMLPDAKGYVSLLRELSGDSHDVRQEMRDRILSTTPDDFKAFATLVEQVRHEGIVKVLGSETAIEQSRANQGDWLEVLRIL